MKRLIAASLGFAILSVALSIFGQTQIYRCADNRIEVAGTIRSIDDSGWFVIDDEVHKPLNIASIGVSEGYIKINYTFTASTIHSFIACPDETFAKAGYIFGTTVYRKYVGIAISRVIDGRVEPVDAATIRSELGNIWIYGLFSVDEQDL
ncbi:MAG: hypothetical protein JRF72_04005 [Deltaproteobacteria bacterium]|jgi:hypothetical protein|nr:hypothetical protein [Deltaproteobacteria bacterium]